MMTFFFAAGAAWLPVVPARAAIATAAAVNAARMPHLVARLTAPSSCRETAVANPLFKRLRDAGSIRFPRGLASLDQTVDRGVQRHLHACPRRLADERAGDVLDLGRPVRLDVLEHRRVVAAAALGGEDIHLPPGLLQLHPRRRGDPLALL